MANVGRIRKNAPLSLVLFSICYFLFVFSDFATSRQTGFVNADRSTVHQFLLLLTAFLLVYFIFHARRIPLSSVFVCLIFLAVWTVTMNFFHGVDQWTILVQGNMSVLWILSYFFFRSMREGKKANSRQFYTYVWIVFLIFSILTVFYFFSMMSRWDRMPVVTISYYAIAMAPWMVAHNPKRKHLILLLSFFIAVLSMKRGAIIAALAMWLIDELLEVKSNKMSAKRFVRNTMTLFLACLIVGIIDWQMDGFLSSRFKLEQLLDGSGRRSQISLALKDIGERSLIHLFFGVGCAQSVQVFETGIHNEWIAFLYNYGVIGIILYFALFVAMFRRCQVDLKRGNIWAASEVLMLTLFLVLSMVSTAYGGYIGIWIFGFWGYVDAERCILTGGRT